MPRRFLKQLLPFGILAGLFLLLAPKQASTPWGRSGSIPALSASVVLSALMASSALQAATNPWESLAAKPT